MGINMFFGNSGDNVSTGFRIGTLLGGRLNEVVSLNGEFTTDAWNPKQVTSGIDASAVAVVLAFSPLAHVRVRSAELVVGPKLGIWGDSETTSSGGQDVGKSSARGGVFGLNAGFFGGLNGSMSIGGLVGFDVRTVHQLCATPAGGSQTCHTGNTGDAEKVLGINGALLF
jgi:hypothetical protein